MTQDHTNRLAIEPGMFDAADALTLEAAMQEKAKVEQTLILGAPKLLDMLGVGSFSLPIPGTDPVRYVAAGTLAEIARAARMQDTCAQMRALCSACGGTGDVHDLTGEWRGPCDCDASAWSRAPAAQLALVAAGTAPAELTDAAIDEVWNGMPGGADGWLKQFGYHQFARAVASHTLVRVAAAIAGTIRPTDDELWDQTIGQRDHYHDMADKLAEAIAKHCGVDIGEHSNANCPWHEALDALASLAPVAAEPVRQVLPPSNAEEIVAFIGNHYDSMDDTTNDPADIKYQLSVHDLLSAFRWWFEDGFELESAPQVPTAAEALEKAESAVRALATRIKDFPERTGEQEAYNEALEHSIAAIRDLKAPAVCAVPPAGWHCTRKPGHDGPCAAWPDTAPSVEVKGEQGEMGGGV